MLSYQHIGVYVSGSSSGTKTAEVLNAQWKCLVNGDTGSIGNVSAASKTTHTITHAPCAVLTTHAPCALLACIGFTGLTPVSPTTCVSKAKNTHRPTMYPHLQGLIHTHPKNTTSPHQHPTYPTHSTLKTLPITEFAPTEPKNTHTT